ncbi:Adenylate and Guanylate cyclase catalytic domain containing protein [Tritrichomonas foetus]|uniref:Adenylate and Guanylate cyclase catalytic domain containing protein n=1 Tax=Tritrichomonas foetus TaxID=1144522 RepID=A0A1J4KDS4_9EUKA|nr:Adenylate and Guanylate cyclase catalytic domain containing protein [Tritrichomonas foetus]|eukprot:OHT07782.1 Adenylate and Guanylate cyclase catalytic domain containing protein [Tritrichomonas foetus]
MQEVFCNAYKYCNRLYTFGKNSKSLILFTSIMNAPESSMMSKSQSEMSNSVNQARVQNKAMSQTFTLLIDQLTQFIQSPAIFFYIALLIILIQMLYISFWPQNSSIWDASGVSNDFAKVLNYIACFSGMNLDPSSTSCLISFLVNTIVFVVVLSVLGAQIVCYSLRRRFFKKTLYPTRIVLELLSAIFIQPTCSFAGQMFLKLFDKEANTVITVAFLIISLIEVIGFSVISYQVNMYIGESIYLPTSILAAFDLRPYLYIIIINPLFTLVAYVVAYFPEWLIHPVICIHIAFVIFVLIKFRYKPFIRTGTNVYLAGGFLASGLLDLFRLIGNFFDNPSGIIGLIVFILFIIIGFVLTGLFFHFQKKRILKNLTIIPDNEEVSVPGEDYRTGLFIDLRLDTDESKALMYYNFIIANNLELYLDFFVAKFIVQHHRTNRALSHCIKVMAFFPPQVRTMNILYSDLIKRHDLNSRQMFLLFQIQKLKMTRQSSSSSLAINRLKELKNNTKELESSIIGFWTLPSVDIEYIGAISKKLTKNRALWEEAINDFPNSVVYREEYMHFFIECETNFSDAIMQRHIIDLIESGRNFNIDYCFRQFVRNFPAYLKKHIVDLKGNFRRGGVKKGASASNSEDQSKSANYNSSTSTISLDMQVEEGIARSIFSQARIRLALQKTTDTKKANAWGTFMMASWFLFVAGMAVFIFLYIFFNGFFDQRKTRASRVTNLVNSRLYLDSTVIALLYYWGNATGAIAITTLSNEYRKVDDPNVQTLMSPSQTWSQRAQSYSVDSRDVFDSFILQIADLAREGTDVYYYMKILFEETTPLSYCKGAEISEAKGQNLKIILPYVTLSTSLLLNEANIENWYFESHMYCQVLSTIQDAPLAFKDLLETIIEMAEVVTEDDEQTVLLLEMVLPAVYGGICLILFLFVSIRYILEIKKLINMLLKLPVDVKKESEEPLRKDINDEKKSDPNTSLSGLNVPVIFCVIICLIYVVTVLLVVFQLENVRYYNQQYENLNKWTSNSEVRKTNLIEVCTYVTQLILNYNTMVSGNPFINASKLSELVTDGFTRIEQYTTNLMSKSGGTPSVAGIDTEIDDLLMKEDCEPNNTNPSYHEMYRCGSAQQLQTFYMNTVTTIEVNLPSYNGMIDEEIPITIFHLASNHLIPKLNQIDARFSEMINTFESEYATKHIIYFVAELIIMVLLIILEMLNIQYLTKCYNVALILMRRVPPVSLVANEDIVNYMLDNTKKQSSLEMSTDQGIIYNTSACVLCTESTGIIEIMNPAVTHTFGYSPEQMLGQSILTMIQEDSRSAVETQIQLMSHKQSGLTFDGHTVCISDNDSPMPCELTLMAMTDSSDNVTSFVILLRDESLLLQQQEEAEKAKKQSESLLYQILPRDIVIRLNQGEKDISFTVPSSTIMFVDVVKFSEYAATLTPQEIMGNLSLMFSGFDESIAKFELLIKIKLIGDVYMCAGGLFTPDEPPQAHAEQMVKFGIECLSVLEDTNVKLNAVLNVRIGVNTGGPLIAGVLGTDKPIFDIIGDPINIASRLQSTDIPGRIQISEGTYELIKDLDFQVEQRGEVFLKGKGKQMAYLVTPVAVPLPGIDSYLHENNYDASSKD